MTTGTTSYTEALRARAATRTSAYGDSIWYTLHELRQHHADPIYFGDGAPAAEAMPIQRLRQASAHAWEEAPAALGYGESEGFGPLRQYIADWMRPRGIEAPVSEIMVTAGSTQGIEVISRAMLNAGDTVIVENPTFLGALEIFETYEVKVVGVEMDEHGMIIDDLRRALAEEPNAKLIYTIPTFQNPTGTTMPIERRRELLALAREHTVVVVEDDPYEALQYDGERMPPLRALDDSVIHLGTFSKTIAPAIRTGWAVAPKPIFELMLAARQLIDLHNDRIAMRTVYYTADGFLREHIASVLPIYRARRDAMLAALEEFLPAGCTWSKPNGGFFVWVELPEQVDVTTFGSLAADHGVIYFPGNWFMPGEPRNNVIRLSFSTLPEARIREGIRRLGEAVRAVLDAE
jgi:2-aminoadipate transaminase